MLKHTNQCNLNARSAERLLKVLANRHRLLILCQMLHMGRARAGDLGYAADLSQSAASQHLAKLREEGIVDYEREAQTLWYKIIDPDALVILSALGEIYYGDREQAAAE